jgi:ech hydrogenase subunit D
MKEDGQEIENISLDELSDSVHKYKDDGFRLVQISCAREEDSFQVTYSFDLDLKLSHIRIQVPPDAEISSVSNIYLAAFVYENEIADLFGLSFSRLAIDYKGTFIRTSILHPFGLSKPEVVRKKAEE